MKGKGIIALIAVLGSSSNPSFAQERRDTLFGEPWTLDRCVEYALENNIDIKRKELVRETKEVAVSEGKWAYLPSVYFSTGCSWSSGRVLDQTTYEFIKNSTVGSSSSSIAGSLNLFSGMSRVYALQRAKLDLQSESASLESLKYDVRKSVTAAFLAALCAEADYQSALRAKALLESQLERIVFLVDAGKVTESDRLQAKAQLYAAECDMATAEGAVQTTKMELCQLLEIRDFASFSIVEDIELSDAGYNLSSTGKIVTSRPEYRSAELAIEIARKDVLIAKSAFYPSLSLSAGYGSSYSTVRQKSVQNQDGTFRYEAYPFFEQYVDNRSSYVSLSLNIPIFNALSTRNAVKRREIAVRDAEYVLQKTEKELNKKYFQAGIECQSAYKKYIAAMEQLNFAEEAERQVRERYELGTADFNAWNTAATELAKARYSFSEAKYTYIFDWKILELF